MKDSTKKHEILDYIESQLGSSLDGETALEAWYEWREACLVALNSDCQPQEILDISTKMLNNPIALFDSSLNMIAYAGEFTGDITGTIWEQLLNIGYSRPELFPPQERQMISRWLNSSQETLRFYSDLYPGNEHISVKCRAGMVSLIDLNSPISPGEQYFVEELAHFLEASLKRSGTIFAGHSESYYIERLLRGMNVNSTAFARHMRSCGWKTNGNFCVYVISEEVPDAHIKNSCMKRLQDHFPYMIILPYEEMLVMISPRPCPEEYTWVGRVAGDLHLKLGRSSVFHRLENLHYSYIQGRIAHSFSGNCQMLTFDEVYMDYCLESLTKLTERKALCHPELLELKESDDKIGAELVNNLRTYLVLGCDIAETARQLHLHRNTLLYRLEKLEGILGFSLKNPPPETRFYLMLSALLLEGDSTSAT